MKEISHLLGRVAVLIPPEEIIPYAGFFAPQAFADITKRYSFQTTPNLTVPLEQIQKEGLKFQIGKIEGEDGKALRITEFNIFHDGLVVNAHSTEDAERFVSDILKWGKEHLGLRDSIRQPRRVFASQVEVEFEASVNKILKKYDEIATLYTNLLMKTYNMSSLVEVQSVRFDYDRLTTPPLYNLAHFVIERKVGSKFEENRFWCQAPLRTADHLHSLQILENLLSK